MGSTLFGKTKMLVTSGILLSHLKKNSTICNDMDGPRGYYASEISQRKINTIWFHLYAESKGEKKEQTNQKQTHKYSGQFGDGQRVGVYWEAGRMGWRGKGVEISSW